MLPKRCLRVLFESLPSITSRVEAKAGFAEIGRGGSIALKAQYNLSAVPRAWLVKVPKNEGSKDNF
jgi:hypothetical protein